MYLSKGMKKRLMKLFRWFVFLTIMGLLVLSISNSLVQRKTKDSLFDSTESIPKNRVGLLLGTSKYLVDGGINQYYKYRIEAAVKLYNAGKIDFILISGDNATRQYNEPMTMRKDLIANGIPVEKIYLDYAGFRTFDSVVRSKEIFGLDSLTVISQPFHNERAIYIARSKGIYAIGFNAQEVNVYSGFKTQVREKLARVKMQLDILFGNEPKYLGKKIEIK